MPTYYQSYFDDIVSIICYLCYSSLPRDGLDGQLHVFAHGVEDVQIAPKGVFTE